MSTIVLNTKNYIGVGTTNGVSNFIERSGGTAASFSRLDTSVKIESKTTRVKWTVGVPVVNVADANACVCPGEVLRESFAAISIAMGAGATVAERTDFVDRLKDLVQSEQFRSSVINLQLAQ